VTTQPFAGQGLPEAVGVSTWKCRTSAWSSSATAGLADRVRPLPAIAADLTDALCRWRDDAPPGSRLGAGATS
jgi:hypothetical protein